MSKTLIACALLVGLSTAAYAQCVGGHCSSQTVIYSYPPVVSYGYPSPGFYAPPPGVTQIVVPPLLPGQYPVPAYYPGGYSYQWRTGPFGKLKLIVR